MSLHAEAARARPSSWPWAIAFGAAASIGLSACTAVRPARDPAPVVTVPPVPVVVATPPPAPVVEVVPTVVVVPAEPVDPATPVDLASRRLLAYHDQLRVLPPNELAQEIARLATMPAAPDTSLELALALMQTRNGGELNRAIGLVDPIAKNGSIELRPWQSFARLLLSRLLELRRLEDLLDKRNLELRDSQREVRQLNEKLEALKAIERSLVNRQSAPSSSVPPAPPASRPRPAP